MGNLFSNSTSTENNKILKLKEIINNIAMYYINNSKFNDMINLNNSDYCNSVTILTKDIINKHMTTLQIEDIYENITENKEPIEMFIGYNNTIHSNKEKMCSKIAEHYTLILHIFNIIKKTFLINDYNNGYNIKENINDKLDENLCNIRNKQINNKLDTSITPNIDDLETFYKLKYNSKVDDNSFATLRNKIEISNKFNNEQTNDNVKNDIIVKIIMASQLKLLSIIDNIFEKEGETSFKIKSNLTNNKLIELADQTKSIITKMYLDCETEYYNYMTKHIK